jgi:uncharacterized protein (DUF488 family)
MTSDNQQQIIFTIGHSNQSLETFFKLLSDNSIQILVDVRSHPYSKYAIQFDQSSLEAAAHKKGIKYVYLGRELGGKPDNPEFYDSEGYVLYDRIAQSSDFINALKRVTLGLNKYKVAIMCSEEDPTKCHRRLLLGRVLADYRIRELHIRGNGLIQTEDELKNQYNNQSTLQLSLFVKEKEETWKSAEPIRLDSQNGPPKDSSKP